MERYKQAAAKATSDAKEKLDQIKRTNEKLLSDYRRVQKQKNELLTAFRKQAQLIDVLKRQKVGIVMSIDCFYWHLVDSCLFCTADAYRSGEIVGVYGGGVYEGVKL